MKNFINFKTTKTTETYENSTAIDIVDKILFSTNNDFCKLDFKILSTFTYQRTSPFQSIMQMHRQMFRMWTIVRVQTRRHPRHFP